MILQPSHSSSAQQAVLHRSHLTARRGSAVRCGLHSLFPEGLLLLLAPHVHHLPVLVDLHGVVHEAVHVDEFNALLVSIVEHGWDDGELAHLLLQVLQGKQREQLVSSTGPREPMGTDVREERTGGGTGELKSKH